MSFTSAFERFEEATAIFFYSISDDIYHHLLVILISIHEKVGTMSNYFPKKSYACPNKNKICRYLET